MSALPDLVTERGNPGNRRRIAAVTVYLDAPLPADGVELASPANWAAAVPASTSAAEAKSKEQGLAERTVALRRTLALLNKAGGV